MRIAVLGAGVGGLAAGARLAALGHRVTVLEQAATPGGKCGRVEVGGYAFDSGPSLLTMPWVLADLFADTGAALEDELELLRVEPGTEYRFADGSSVALGADLPPTVAALERFSPGAGEDWARHLGACAGMWRASAPVLSGPAPWPPRRPRRGERRPSPADLLRIRPWRTLRGLARSTVRDPRLRLVIERGATYAGADPRRAPAALAVAGYVEHAFGAWHVRGGLYAIVEALTRRLGAAGGELRLGTAVRRVTTVDERVAAVETDSETLDCDAVVSTVDAALESTLLSGDGATARPGAPATARVKPERSLSGFALMLGLRGRTPRLGHHTILFPPDYDAEFDDVFVHRRPVRDPTLYVAAASVTDPDRAPPGDEGWFVLANAPVHGERLDWDAHADAYEEHLLDRLARRGLDVRDRIAVRARRTPADLERETGAPGGAIYGAAPHGRLGTIGRPTNAARRPRGLYRAGGTVHPGGGLPLVMLGAKVVAEEIGPAR
ncbi:MAG: phytoene desaturase family protein [Thermoleophilaceae bacterium]